MIDTLLTIAAINPSGTAETLHFSQGGYKSAAGVEYVGRLKRSALVKVAPNDGGLLPIFGEASVGDIELENTDGALDYLASYGMDGGAVVVSFFNGTDIIERFSGVAGTVHSKGGSLVVPVKAAQESLKDDFPLAVYAGDNTLPAGLEGTEDTIKGAVKPQLWGDCRNITPIAVNTVLQIYQASDRDDVVITAVYMDGVRWINYRTNSAYSVGATTITLAYGLGDIATGSQVMFDGHFTIYTVTDGLEAGVIVISPGLTKAVPLKAAVEVVNFYPDITALQQVDYIVDGDHAVGDTTIAVAAGVGVIAVGYKVTFAGHLAVYTVSAALSAGVFTIAGGLQVDLVDGELVQVLGDSNPVLWGGCQGYLRLAAQSTGVVTCDAVSMDSSGNVHKAGDVFQLLAEAVGLTVDSAGVTEFNAVGTLGLYLNAAESTESLLNKIALSVIGFYWFESNICKMQVLSAPASSAAYEIDDYQLVAIEQDANGLGKNGVPVYKVLANYDRIETVQATVAGSVSSAFRQRLKTQWRQVSSADMTVLARYRSSVPLEIESLLRDRAAMAAAVARLFAIAKVRRDVLALTMDIADVPSWQMGETYLIVTPRYGYSAGKKFVLVGYELDDNAHLATLRFFG